MRNEAGLAALCGLDDPVRGKLYDYVCAAAVPVGRDEAAAAAGVRRPLAAYHLDKLVELGLLTAGYARPPGRPAGPGAGRPAKVYARSGREFAVAVPPRDYELAARLLATAVRADPSGAALGSLRGAARELGASLGRPGEPVARQLAEHGFEPRPDGRGGLTLRNCPFRRLAADHPDVVCAMNLALLDGVLHGIGATALEAVLDPGDDRCCVLIRRVATGPGAQPPGVS